MVATSCRREQQKAQTEDDLAQYRDTLIGKFNGFDIDVLIAEQIDTTKEREMWDWRIYSKNNTVDTLILSQRFCVKMIQEGDLDGNGTDEFGIRREGEIGNWDNYYIYSFSNGYWKYLIRPVLTYSTHFYNEQNNGKDIAEKTNRPEVIKVRFSDLSSMGEDVIIKDTLIQINPQSIIGL